MLAPQLTETEKQTVMTEVFLGYDHNLELSDGEFYDMENLTSDCYPLLAPRVRRGTVQALSGVQAICARDRLCWVQNQVLHINGASMEAYMPSVNIKAGEKQLVSMGASPFQIITKVMIPESVPSLISNGTIALTTVLGYSAMSGIIGGGGLGKIAINYGYYRYQYLIMVFAVVFLIILVQIFQSLGTYLATKCDKRLKNRK